MLLPNREALLTSSLNTIPFVLFDLESTGLDPVDDRVCEVALARWQDGVVVETYEALINPRRPVTPDAFAVNGISDAMVKDAPSFRDTVPMLRRHFEDAVLVAHNAPFDICFINTELLRAGYGPLENPVVDTLSLARHFIVQPRYNLAALALRVGVPAPSHRAMSDVRALIAVFADLLERLQDLGVDTLEDLMRAQRGVLPGEPEPLNHPMILEALRRGRRLRIAYRTGGGEPVSREVLPLELHTANGLPRMVAFCFLRNDQRTFYVDRIAELRWADE